MHPFPLLIRAVKKGSDLKKLVQIALGFFGPNSFDPYKNGAGPG